MRSPGTLAAPSAHPCCSRAALQGGLGPMQGQADWFGLFAEELDELAIERYISEVQRLYSVMDRWAGRRERGSLQVQLAVSDLLSREAKVSTAMPLAPKVRYHDCRCRQLEEREWLAAGRYTLADIACFPWVLSHDLLGALAPVLRLHCQYPSSREMSLPTLAESRILCRV